MSAKSMRKGLDWVFAMQNRDGGWGSFDKDNNKTLFQYVPYADHNAMLDPSSADITARTLEMCPTSASETHPNGAAMCNAPWTISTASRKRTAPGSAAGA